MLLAGIVAVSSAPLAAQVSLGVVVDLAQRNSSAVKLAQADVRKAEASLSATKDVYIPNLMIGSGLPALPDVGFTGGVPSIINGNVQSLVFSIPQKQYMDAARAGLKAATLSLKDAREQAALDVSLNYIELDAVQHSLETVHQQETLASRLVEIEQQRTEAGVDPLSELLQAQLIVAQMKLKRIHLESRVATLQEQIAVLTGLPAQLVITDRTSIPEIPAVTATHPDSPSNAIQATLQIAISKQKTARGDWMSGFLPQLGFNAMYSRSTTILNDFNSYYAKPIPTNNFSSGFSIQFPFLDFVRNAKAKQSAADALRATAEAEQAARQNEVQIASLSNSLRELDAEAEIATLKQQIADEQLHAVLTQLELGNGAGSGANAQPQLSPKAEQQARIDERQKFLDSLDATLDLSKTRLSLLRALGHMEDWLNLLHTK
jgi:outer membrane protein TolC